MVEVKTYQGRPVLFIDGEPRNPVMYSPPGVGAVHFEPIWRRATERFNGHDVDVYLMGVPQRWEKKFTLDNFWDGDTITADPLHLSPEELDAGPALALAQNPNAYVMVRFVPRPPLSWREAHPDEMSLDENGQRELFPSLASSLYARAAADYCHAYIRFCESRPWADRCIGYVNYHLCEGCHGPIMDSWLFDHSPAMTARWRAYLLEKYETVDRLREAHGDASLTFDRITVPHDRLDGLRRDVAGLLYWQAGQDNAVLRDYLLLLRDLYHENFRLVARASREAAGPGKLLLHDALKLPMQGWSNFGFFSPEVSWPIVYAETAAGSGNMDVLELADAPGVDGLATPYDYQVRGAGGVFEPEGAADSMVLRGKLFFVEQDVRTYAGGITRFGGMRDVKEFAAVMWRDLATALTRGFMNYFCDHNADYFADPAMQPTIARQARVLRESVNWPHETPPGIAMVLDDRASLETNGAGHVMNEAVMWEQKIGLSRCGVPYRVYLFDDLTLPNFPDHRVVYFPNLHRVDERRMQVLRDKVFRDGRVVVWGPGSGISDGDTIGPGSASRLTGFAFTCQGVNYQRRVQISQFDHPITRGLKADTIFGGATSYGPVLYPTDGVRLGLAWSKMGGDDTGLAVKSFGRGARGEQTPAPSPSREGGECQGPGRRAAEWEPPSLSGRGQGEGCVRPQPGSGVHTCGEGDYAAVFTTAVPLAADLWRAIARYAGAHVYTDTNDIVLADSSVVALHSLKSGPRVLTLPGARRVTDLVTGDRVAERTEQIEFDLDAPGTGVFLLQE